ncbi:XisH family protein [Coleofasciculus chthonoplastes]|uniref:XisH family protein n=1 Tax=Coleofasciculus chthonoplastes TaxID=64178 RepID=UPI0032F17BEA
MARDAFHNAVKVARQKEGWVITADPLQIKFGKLDLYIDLGAEQVIGAEQNGQKIAIEIKSFLGQSTVTEFHRAVGQFISYRDVLRVVEPERVLYLAVPQLIYDDFFKVQELAQLVVQTNQIKIIVYNPVLETIVQWIN